MITAGAGVILFPWKLPAGPEAYIFSWLGTICFARTGPGASTIISGMSWCTFGSTSTSCPFVTPLPT